MYKFPKSAEERKLWKENLPRQSNLDNITQWMGVCRLHFSPDVRMKKLGLNERPVDPPEKGRNKAPDWSQGEFVFYIQLIPIVNI